MFNRGRWSSSSSARKILLWMRVTFTHCLKLRDGQTAPMLLSKWAEVLMLLKSPESMVRLNDVPDLHALDIAGPSNEQLMKITPVYRKDYSTRFRTRPLYWVGAWLGFSAGFLIAYIPTLQEWPNNPKPQIFVNSVPCASGAGQKIGSGYSLQLCS
ncbi:hypothetical protein DFH06DRAFT_660467 [Mycena polygramma]|nr:hypothetical protein DFH06DRAFT_660467 [Mycena polygramma]